MIRVEVVAFGDSVAAAAVLVPTIGRGGRVLRIGQELEAGPGDILLGEGDNPVSGMGDEVDNVADVTGGSVNKRLVPVVSVLNLDDVGEVCVVVGSDDVFLLRGPVVVLGIECLLGGGDGVGSRELGSGGAHRL